MNPTLLLLKRECLRFFRQRGRLVGSLATPLMFWAVLGGGLGESFSIPGGPGQSYGKYFFPGAVMMAVLFTAIFSTISVIEDRNEGFLQGVLISPLSHGAVVWAKILSGSILGLIQGFVILLAAPLLGYSLAFSEWAHIILILFLSGAGLTGVGFIVAWWTNSSQGYHSFMNLLLFPMWLLSGAVFPVQGSHIVFRALSAINPITYGMKLFRAILNHSFLISSEWILAYGVLLAFILTTVSFSRALVLRSE